MSSAATTARAATLPHRTDLSPARRRLFVTALSLFSRDGYYGVSVRDIAKELDQAPTAIYAHVSSKEELLYELVKMGHEELRDQIRLAVLEADGAPEAQLRAIVTANALTHLALPDLARVCHAESGYLSPEQTAVIEVLIDDMGALLRDVINRGVAQGVFDAPDLNITASAIAAMGARVVDRWKPELGVDPQHVADTHAELAVRMLTRS
jgi:AcrR family transcriptional regulator